MTEIRIEESGSACLLFLEGDLTMERAKNFKKALLDSLDRADQVTIRVDKVDEISLSCLQLLCSAHRSALKNQKHLSISGPYSESFSLAVKCAALESPNGCPLEQIQSCLWTGGEGQ